MSEPLIPAKYAELLYVSFSVLVAQMRAKKTYPTENLETVLRSYEQSRNKTLLAAGFTDLEIRELTVAATESLTEWLDEKAAFEEASEQDFEEWLKELTTE